MATKSVGYVELEWKCPVCGTRNRGSQRVCTSCGSPQPDDVQFENPVQAELVKEPEAIAQAKAAPDIHCPFCDARNPAGATTCKQCGGDLSSAKAREAGRIVGALNDKPAPQVACPACKTMNPATALRCSNCGAPLPRPQPKPAAQPAPATQSRGCMIALAAAAVLFVVGIIAFIALSGRTDTAQATAVGGHWERSVDVQELVPVTRIGWLDEIPQGAAVQACREEVRRVVSEPVDGAREVCGTPYTIDQGTGFGEVVQDCQYEILEDRCEYTVREWRTVDKVVVEGDGLSAQWPALSLSSGQREGSRNERYVCTFTYNDETYTYELPSDEAFRSCEAGSHWTIEINTFGQITSAEPVP